MDDSDLQEEGASSVGNTEARVREIALQAMIEATSQARIGRALRTSTQHPAERIFQKGDVVEYHRPSISKDISGWLGPVDIVEVLPEQGQLLLKLRIFRSSLLNTRLQTFYWIGIDNPRVSIFEL